MFLLIAHFDGEGSGQPAGSAEALRWLGDQPDTRSLRWGRSTEAGGRWVLVAEFDTAAAFRRAQSPFPVRAAMVPWLAAASSSAVYEVTAAVSDGTWSEPEVIVDDPRR